MLQNTTSIINFWNGNRSEIRQAYERAVLDAVLTETVDDFGNFTVIESKLDYPGREESTAFTKKNNDLLVTVAGNKKFDLNQVILIPIPLANNLLGYRIPIVKKVHKKSLREALTASSLKQLKLGIPETWSDAALFRHNAYNVVEEGNFNDIFKRLETKRVDYITFGVNEILSIFESKIKGKHDLVIDEEVLFFYPFPLVFYVHPEKEALANRMRIGLSRIVNNGILEELFNVYFANEIDKLNLAKRNLIELENPDLPAIFGAIKPKLVVE